MQRFELVTEIFNSCSNNQMRDVAISEIETDDPEKYVRELLKGNSELHMEVTEGGPGVTIIDVDADGLRERFSFSED